MTVEWWQNLDAGWVVLDGERMGWVSRHPEHVSAYNRGSTWMGRFPDLDAALAAFGDERFQDWRLIDPAREERGLEPIVKKRKDRARV